MYTLASIPHPRIGEQGKNRLHRRIAMLCLICLLMSLMSTAVLAEEEEAAAVNSSSTTIATNINKGIYKLYDIATKVILSVALVAVIIIGFNIITGGDRGMDMARSKAIRVVLAVIIVYLAPLIIENLSGWVTASSGSVTALPGWGG